MAAYTQVLRSWLKKAVNDSQKSGNKNKSKSLSAGECVGIGLDGDAHAPFKTSTLSSPLIKFASREHSYNDLSMFCPGNRLFLIDPPFAYFPFPV